MILVSQIQFGNKFKITCSIAEENLKFSKVNHKKKFLNTIKKKNFRLCLSSWNNHQILEICINHNTQIVILIATLLRLSMKFIEVSLKILNCSFSSLMIGSLRKLMILKRASKPMLKKLWLKLKGNLSKSILPEEKRNLEKLMKKMMLHCKQNCLEFLVETMKI